MAPKRELEGTKTSPSKRSRQTAQATAITSVLSTTSLLDSSELSPPEQCIPSTVRSLPLLVHLTNSIFKNNISQPIQSTSPAIMSDDISSSSTEHCMYSFVSSLPFHINHLGETDDDPSASTSTQLPPNSSPPSSLIEQSLNSHPEPSEQPLVTTSHTVEDPPMVPSTKKRREKASSATTTAVVSIGSVIPKPTKCFIDPDRVSGCSDELLRQAISYFTSLLSDKSRRITTLSNYVNISAKTYALGLIPSNATWGKYDPYDDRSKELCVATTNDKINIWIVGHVTSLWFMKNGAPDNQCAISIMPLSNSLGLQTNKLIAGLSSPNLRTFFLQPKCTVLTSFLIPALTSSTPGVIHAVRWQMPKLGGDV